MERDMRLTDSITWYIVFDKCRGRHWTSRFLHKDFQHVLLWRAAGEGSILVNPLSHACFIGHCEESVEDQLKNEALHGATAILSMTVHYGSHYKLYRPSLFTCVTIAKRILCLKSWRFTPRQLYTECIKAGAEIIKPWCITS
jgi:hypothetical protein